MDTGTKSYRSSIHQGRNVRRTREILGIEKTELAKRLDMTEQALSQCEQNATIEDTVLQKIATELNVPAELFANLNDDATMNFISNTFNMSDTSIGANNNCTLTFNPVEKIVELYNEKIELYERMLKAEQEKVAVLQKNMEGNKK